MFQALQSAYFKNVGDDKNKLIEKVQKCFEDYPHTKINNAFLTLMCCMNEIVKIGGDNCYKIPHMSKAKLEWDGTLPWSIEAYIGDDNPFDAESEED